MENKVGRAGGRILNQLQATESNTATDIEKNTIIQAKYVYVQLQNLNEILPRNDFLNLR